MLKIHQWDKPLESKTVQNQLRRENITPQEVVSYFNPDLFIFYFFYLSQFHPNKAAVMFYHRG